MDKQVIDADVPGLGIPLNLAVRFGPLFFVSGLPPFHGAYAVKLRQARERGEAPPPFPDMPFPEQVNVVMDHLKKIVEAAGSTMDHLLKVNVWLKNQNDMTAFDRVYRTYFTSSKTYPARTRLQAGATPLGCGLEVEAIGYIPGVPWGTSKAVKRVRVSSARKRRTAGSKVTDLARRRRTATARRKR